MNNRVEEVEIYTRWRIKTKRCNEEAECTRRDTERESASEREDICQLQQTQSSCTLTHTASHDKLHQRGAGGEEGGRRHCTESTSTTMDGHTPNTHTHAHTLLHRVPVCVPLHSPGCQNLAVSCQEKTANEPINKQTDKKKNNTHFGSHWLLIKK